MDIGFLFPEMLWALSALTIPLLIHLLTFQRPKKAYFTRVLFLEKLQDSQRNFNRLKNILVLAARSLFLIFLVLGFAQPIWKDQHAKTITGLPHLFLWIDNSYSMQAKDESYTRLEQAIILGENLINALPENAKIHLTTNDFSNSSYGYLSKSKALDRLSELDYYHGTKPLQAVWDRQQSFASKVNSDNITIYWLTDAQKSTIPLDDLVLEDSSQRITLLKIGKEDKANRYVDSLWLSDEFATIGDQQKSLQFSIRSSTGGQERKVGLKMLLNSIQTATALQDIKPGETIEKEFVLTNLSSTATEGRIEIEDEGPNFDDTAYFVIKARQKPVVVSISEGQNSYLSKLFSDTSLIAFHSFPMLSLNYSKAKNADLLILNQIKEPTQALQNLVREVGEEGSSIFIIPHPEFSAELYNANILAGFTSVSKNSPTEFSTIAQPNSSIPFFKGAFEKQPSNVELPRAKLVVLPTRKGEPLLRFQSGKPFLTRYTSSTKGTMFLLASPLEEEYSTFQRHAYFVVSMLKIAKESIQDNTQIAYSLDNPSIELPAKALENTANILLEGNNRRVYPEPILSGNKLKLVLEKSQLTPGYFNIMQGDKNIAKVAFNLDHQESILTTYSEEELVSKLPEPIAVQTVVEDPSVAAAHLSSDGHTALWRYCIALALLFLLTEMLLIRFIFPAPKTIQTNG